jgi:hypothetical protein
MVWKSETSISLGISNKFAALEKLGDVDDDYDVDINKAWGSFRKNIKSSAIESLYY